MYLGAGKVEVFAGGHGQVTARFFFGRFQSVSSPVSFAQSRRRSSRLGTWRPMYLNMATLAHSEMETPFSAAARLMAVSSSSDMAMEMVFLLRWSGSVSYTHLTLPTILRV